ncbi:MAG: tRNA (adenosine(37)-N6)-threonylcarbamoyltransferase complex dimerization subunit type 1 TsaB [Planctomycetes bacterium]|nr:tRNA (adenosine(37)-N6)-threonylcarbamoyltransferase complex dimerization subunit type 1 TsaB [Planctomycetota bacterium]
MSRVREAQSDPNLAIETSGVFGSVALGLGDALCGTHEFATPRAHAVDFLPAIARLCRTHDVEPTDLAYVFLSIGPGSFTGLRIGVSAARMIAFSTHAKIVGVSTLTVVAQNANLLPQPPDSVTVLLDAKRQHVYAASFRRVSGVYHSDAPAEEVDPDSFLATRPKGSAVLGAGLTAHCTAVERCGLVILPEALHRARAETVYALGLRMAQDGEIVQPRTLVPDYIRRPEAEERWEQRQAGGTRHAGR